MRSGQRSLSFTLLALTAGAALSACSGGGGGGGEFAITSINLNNGAVYHITAVYNHAARVLTVQIRPADADRASPPLFSTQFGVDLAATVGGDEAVMGFTAANGGRASRYEIHNFRYDGPNPEGPPVVQEVYVRGSAWASAFKAYLEGQGIGDDVFGYRVDTLAGNEAILPWTNGDEVVVRYGAPPADGGIPDPASVVLHGQRSDYSVASVTQLDPQTFVLRLDRSLGNLSTGGENGDRVALAIPGAGASGQPYGLTFTVLQGDVDRTGSVVAADFSDVKARFFRSTNSPGSGATAYSVFHDVDGNGSVIASDFSLVKARFFDNLPSPPPPQLTTPESITSLFFPGQEPTAE
jgi:hypothetical protein